MSVPGFEIVEHTADIGIRVRGRNPKELFINAALGMCAIMTDPARVSPDRVEPIEVEAESLPELLVAWLNEIIYMIEAKEMLFSHYEIASLTPTRLAGTIAGETFDPDKHDLKIQIKACTYHELKVGKENSNWFGQVIFDI